MKYLLGLLLISFLSIHTFSQETEVKQTVSKSFELGEAILLFMKNKDDQETQPEWSYRLDEVKDWITDGVETINTIDGKEEQQRDGSMRINVLGIVVEVLRKKMEELEWGIRYHSYSPAKFGIESITITPVLDALCTYSVRNCDFDLLPSLIKNDIKFKQVCIKKKDNGFETIGYELSHKDKKNTLVIFYKDGGSAGLHNEVKIFFNRDINNLCENE